MIYPHYLKYPPTKLIEDLDKVDKGRECAAQRNGLSYHWL